MSDESTGAGDLTVGRAREILLMAPETRRERGLDDDVSAALAVVIERASGEEKQLGDVSLGDVSLEFDVLEGVSNEPLDLRGARIDSIDLSRASVRVPIDLDGATIGELTLDYATIEHDLSLSATTIETVAAYETTFAGDVDLDGATISGRTIAREATFEDDVSCESTTFEGDVVLDAAELYGESNRLDDNTRFQDARFDAAASFRETRFGYVEFEGATFAGPAVFTDAVFDGDADFGAVEFRGEADFADCQFLADTNFAAATFDATAEFVGAAFHGQSTALEEDVSFADVTFAETATFNAVTFRGGTFADATFGADARFEGALFRDDADFSGVTVDGFADFDETRFQANADFSGAHFRTASNFRGAEFHGGANHLDVAAMFRETRFDDDADFDNALFGTATFEDAVFSGRIDFSSAAFEDDFTFAVSKRGEGTYVDFTGATLKEGTIRQRDGEWVHYDLTEASIGDLEFAAERTRASEELLDYVRFAETEFNEFDGYDFDFSDQTEYFDRNDWRLHGFDNVPAGYTSAVEMTPETIERTYLKAKIAASSGGNRQAAGEFRVKRQRFARQKYWGIVRDETETMGVRLRNAARAIENAFLDVTCGHGLRLSRIIGAFALFPLFPGLLYTLGGPFETAAPDIADVSSVLAPEGLAMLYENVYFSYISFLTIGYGNIGPQGWAARMLAAGEVYVSVVLGGLVIYALVKRSEV